MLVAVTAARLASDLGRDAPTIEMPLAPGRTGRAFRWLGTIVLLALAGIAAVLAGRKPASVVLTNGLIEPISVTVDGAEHIVSPGRSFSVSVARGSPLDARWHTLRPRSTAGRELGLALEGTIQERGPRGTVRRGIDLLSLARPFVAPVVTNTTDGPLSVTLRDARGVAVDCDCAVAPGVTASIGYRDPALIAALEFTDRSGRTARIVGLAARADRATGAAPIRLGPSDFAAARVGGEPVRTPVTVVLPLPRTELITDSVPQLPPDTVAGRAEPVRRPPPAPDRPAPRHGDQSLTSRSGAWRCCPGSRAAPAVPWRSPRGGWRSRGRACRSPTACCCRCSCMSRVPVTGPSRRIPLWN